MSDTQNLRKSMQESTLPDSVKAVLTVTQVLAPKLDGSNAAAKRSVLTTISTITDHLRDPLNEQTMPKAMSMAMEFIHPQPDMRKMADSAGGLLAGLLGARALNQAESGIHRFMYQQMAKSSDPTMMRQSNMERALAMATPAIGVAGCMEAATLLKSSGVTGGICAGLGLNTGIRFIPNAVRGVQGGIVADIRF
jgi:hypothetical protein